MPVTILRTKHINKFNDFYVNDIRCVWYDSFHITTKNLIIYFHGGGYAIGSSEIYFDLCKKLRGKIKDSNTNFLLIDYKKSPEYKLVEIVNSTFICYKYIISLFENKNILFMGDSAGANLAIQICNLAIINKLHNPSGLICLSPWIISRIKGKYWKDNINKDYLTPYTIDLAKRALSFDYKNENYNILNFNFEKFPNILVRAGRNELILDEILAFVSKIKKYNCKYEFHLINNMVHSFDLFYSFFKEDSPKFNKLINFIDSNLE